MRVLAAAASALLLLVGCAPAATSQEEQTIASFAIDSDFPDPDLMLVDDTYYAYATNGPGFNIRMATSTDLATWEVATTDPLPTLPDWAIAGKTWAPDVSEFSPGNFVMYYTAANSDPAVQCIGVATSTSPTGPFEPQGDGPLVCPADDGGAIDPSTFVDDDGTRFLLFKNDGNCCDLDTYLQIVALSDDGLSLAGEPTKLIKQDQAWEGNLVEAPTLVKRDGKYLLFYSANDYGGSDYATGYATADAATGPFTKADGPFLTTDGLDGKYPGPGGQDVITSLDGSDVIVFHSWDEAFVLRGMNVLPITFSDGVPSL